MWSRVVQPSAQEAETQNGQTEETKVDSNDQPTDEDAVDPADGTAVN